MREIKFSEFEEGPNENTEKDTLPKNNNWNYEGFLCIHRGIPK